MRLNILQEKRLNLYDFLIIIILALLSLGNIGGALAPLRLAAGPLFVFAILYKSKVARNRSLEELYIFLIAFFIYMLLSLFWTLDYEEAIKEVFYFIIHSSILLSLIFFARKAAYPFKSICVGWMISVAITMPLAMIEFIFDWHLPMSLKETDTMINYGGGLILQKTFASVTFGNWNGYVVFLGFSLPFIIGGAHLYRMRKTKYLSLILFIFMGVVLIVNASRGGFVAYVLASCFGSISYFRSKAHRKISTSLIFITIIIVGGTFNYDFLSTQLLSRLNSNAFLDDPYRESLFTDGLELLVNSNFIGVGVGSLVAAYEKLGSDILLPHNVFLELLAQYGLAIFCFFIYLLYRVYYLSRRSTDDIARFVVLLAVIILPVVGIIGSSYWLSPILWCYLASVFVIAYNPRSRIDSSLHLVMQ